MRSRKKSEPSKESIREAQQYLVALAKKVPPSRSATTTSLNQAAKDPEASADLARFFETAKRSRMRTLERSIRNSPNEIDFDGVRRIVSWTLESARIKQKMKRFFPIDFLKVLDITALFIDGQITPEEANETTILLLAICAKDPTAINYLLRSCAPEMVGNSFIKLGQIARSQISEYDLGNIEIVDIQNASHIQITDPDGLLWNHVSLVLTFGDTEVIGTDIGKVLEGQDRILTRALTEEEHEVLSSRLDHWSTLNPDERDEFRRWRSGEGKTYAEYQEDISHEEFDYGDPGSPWSEIDNLKQESEELEEPEEPFDETEGPELFSLPEPRETDDREINKRFLNDVVMKHEDWEVVLERMVDYAKRNVKQHPDTYIFYLPNQTLKNIYKIVIQEMQIEGMTIKELTPDSDPEYGSEPEETEWVDDESSGPKDPDDYWADEVDGYFLDDDFDVTPFSEEQETDPRFEPMTYFDLANRKVITRFTERNRIIRVAKPIFRDVTREEAKEMFRGIRFE